MHEPPTYLTKNTYMSHSLRIKYDFWSHVFQPQTKTIYICMNHQIYLSKNI